MSKTTEHTVGLSMKKLNKSEMENIYGASGVTPRTTPATTLLASFVASYIASAEFRCGKDNK
ncbi:mersacidin family lantibiotic (plasmid) [Priestia megaterium]|uniref:Type 2 lantibiotic, family protein n=1 Tax=Priestia megaterium (strain ATCC 14581 / DSM 32 / CCUG 1817 / JCM 2506 / NBRC 15308 / NCIMB 9376 / NCTC 10342 / NRRL B-14308 / VKM B-512 / Ford 19) TaxID=1348623 RepID=A0A0B6AL04_PRIM2|nr:MULTISPECIES: mersacidin family lantibiotic [Priestia]AJI25565.1 type 2 lantibiotic, family protein [Priestia megaterium NBRC 15308 = ATCC 14581]KFN07528.1 type 2 lantibiotic, family protein [Priestia megaterium]MCM3255743.1 mersacidin family lantibiotic [Priestia aryabhattai]MDR4229744.1 type 2 lantibiotic [Priestia megaterium]MED4399188.1 mersacidin family lantibiotic [Priestia megaterium]